MGMGSSASISIFFAITLLATQLVAAEYTFVFQWPGSLCNSEKGCCYPKTGKPAADFTITGLWLQDWEPMPKYCNNQSLFEISKIQDLRKRLEKSWPLLSCPGGRSSENLWRREWKKYGTCLNLTQHQYFKTALIVKEGVDILKILKNAGFEPNGTSLYNPAEVYNAVESAIKVRPGLVCNNDKLGKRQLFQITMCAEADGTLTDCMFLPKYTCRDFIYFPPF